MGNYDIQKIGPAYFFLKAVGCQIQVFLPKALFFGYLQLPGIDIPGTVVTHGLGRCFADTDTHFSH